MDDCIRCGQTRTVCKCYITTWSLKVVKAMVAATDAVAAYKAASTAEHPLKRLELRDAMEKAQGRVIDLQWAELGDKELVKPAA